MIIISHRANIVGPNKEKENTMESILHCITRYKLHVEIDIHVENKQLCLGHDSFDSNRVVDLEVFRNVFLFNRDKLWIHCKNLNALLFCQEFLPEFNYFGHNNDDFVLTSKGYIFTRPGTLPGKNVICVMPEMFDTSNIDLTQYTGILTDYPLLYSK